MWERCRPAVGRAFAAAVGSGDDAEDGASAELRRRGGQLVVKKEFRLLLIYLRRYLELLAAFDVADSNRDRRLDFGEFVASLPHLAAWGVRVTDPRAAFAEIDADGNGTLDIDEFCELGRSSGISQACNHICNHICNHL